MKNTVLFLSGLAFCALFGVQNAGADENEMETGIKVIGLCEKEVEPDRVAVVFRLEETRNTVEESTERANKRYNKLVKEITGLQLKNAVLQTTQYSTSPRYVWENKKRRLKGYETSIALRVETSELKKAGAIIQAGSKSAQENIQGPYPFVSKALRDKIHMQCIAIAGEDANQKANAVAKSLKIKLGKAFKAVEMISTQGAPPMPYMTMAKSAGMEASAPADIKFGKENFTLRLEVSFYAD